ncbi:PPP1R12C family protein [Megaselia abdita]
MSSNLDMRNHSALMKRAEQLKRWEESDTNKESPHPKPEKLRKIRFPSGCVFLASCLSGDKDEVVKLLEDGADINTANVDGLTALHQACIDDNLDMVEFLVKQGADINRQDNEGWTPLHATASCGFVSIARFLVENGADLQAVNSDGELAVDISHCNDMADYLQSLVQELGIDCEAARRAEEELMYADAKKWLRSDASELDTAHPKTGATALHVAAAKGYSRVLKLIFAGRANVDKQDNDGWTPLHAAAHWCQKEACELLVNQMADMDVRNYAGQTCIDVADRSLRAFLEDLRANNKRNKKRPAADLSRIPDSTFPEKKIENHSPKLIRYDGKDEKEKEDKTKSHLQPPSPSVPAPSSNSSSTESLKVQSDSINDDDTPWRRNPSRIKVEDTTPKIQVPEKDNKLTSDDVILRRTQSFENDEKFYQKYNELRARIKANSCPILPAGTGTQTQTQPTQQHPTVVLGTLTTSNQTNQNLISNSNSNYSVQRSASLKDHSHFRKPAVPPQSPNTPLSTPNAGQVRCLELEAFDQSKNGDRSPTPTSSYPIANAITKPKLSPGSIFKNFFKSFVPPVRDEESETQRKAHARSVRQTRRSTQGVTLEEIKSAEELIKKKNANINNNNNDTETESQNTPSTSSTTTTTTTPKPSNDNERIPSPNPKTEEMDNEITATFTIKPRESLNSSDNSNSKLVSASASYTLSPPVTTAASLTLPVIVPPSLNLDKLKPTTAVTTSTTTSSSSPSSSSSSSTTSSSTASGASENETESLEEFNMEMINNDDDDHKIKPQTTKIEPPLMTTPIPKPISDEKRSLFDLDNENSITLADKLRNEANKYYEDDVVLRRSGANSNSTNDSNAAAERRPSWRLKFDAGSKFKLEDASSGNTYPPPNNTIISSAPAVIAAANLSSSSAAQRRNISNNTPPITSNQRPVSVPTNTNNSNASTQETSSNDINRIRDSTKSDLALSKRNTSREDKENEQENDSRAAQATQSIIQRRRKPKRRSTGVVHVDMDDIDPDKQDSGDNDEKESGTERTSRSRLGSTNSVADGDNKQSNENGEIDYKALWEAAMLENDKLKQMLKKKDEEIVTAKAAVERFAHTQLDAFKTENKRLKEENGALIRVISKLSK